MTSAETGTSWAGPFRAAEPLTLTRKGAAPQTAGLAVASFERTSISGALGSCGWGIAVRVNSAIAPGRKMRQ
jgi:hypothetical protein